MFIVLWIYIFEHIKNPFSSRADKLEAISSKLSKINIIYVKLFQILSTAKDNLTQEEMDVLKFYTENVPYERDEIDLANIIRQLSKYNISLSTFEPVASGIISIIYNAVDNTTGLSLIVKKKRINIENRIYKDIKNIRPFVKFLSFFTNINICDIFEENVNMIINQTDFLKESNNIKYFYDNNIDSTFIKVPKVYQDITYNEYNIIVMEKIEGNKLCDVSHADKELYLHNLSKITVKSIVLDKVFHADMHQGNIIFMPNGVIGLIDYGIVGYLSREEQDIYMNFFKYLYKKNFDELTNHLINSLTEPECILNAMEPYDKDELFNYIKTILVNVFNISGHLSHNDLNDISKRLLHYNLSLSKKFCKFELAMACSDGVLKILGDNICTPIDCMVSSIDALLPVEFLELMGWK